jgi:ornithine cyclodeaminase/alanine dehydrogenase-like protein (mu-crystallin family)
MIGRCSWAEAVEALRRGHMQPKAEMADIMLGPPEATLLSRGTFISGVGYGVKSVTVLDGNAAKGLPTIQGAMLVFEPEGGRLAAIIESRLVTELKTAADSVLGALLLARPESSHLLIVGAGAVARSLVHAYLTLFPRLQRVSIWSRRFEQASALARSCEAQPAQVVAIPDLAAAASRADIIATATMAREPILRGGWIKRGTHIDLIGAYKADMREADDDLISNGRLFVDSRESTKHIGELSIPLANGAITAQSVLGDLYDLIQGCVPARCSEEDITIFKNGGGAHLDLMVARSIIDGKFQCAYRVG